MAAAAEGDLILVADDDEHIVDLVSMYLRRAGYRVEAAFDGDETLRKTHDLRPALLVLDILMPGPDGLQICRSLRRRSDVPIILLTATTSDIDKIAGLRVGADDYVTKPFKPDELVARVDGILRRARAQKDGAAAARPERLRLRQAAGSGEAGPEGAGPGGDAGREAMLRVPGRPAPPLAGALEFLQR